MYVACNNKTCNDMALTHAVPVITWEFQAITSRLLQCSTCRDPANRSAYTRAYVIFAHIAFLYTMYLPNSRGKRSTPFSIALLLDVLLQTPQPLLCLLQHLVLLANREP
jgi:hypothetical protein